MDLAEYENFNIFCQQRKDDLQRIASHTKGAHDPEDVKGEALIMATDIRSKENIEIDWLRPEDQDRVISHLFQRLVRYTERHFMYATRLDRWRGDGIEDEVHPLMRTLVADDGADPEAILIARQEARAEIKEPDCHHSLASAYVHLLRRFDNKMTAVADHLLISLSYCYRCYARVRVLAECQQPIPIEPAKKEKNFTPRAWRPFRLRREPLQLAFDFDIAPLLDACMSEPEPVLSGA